MLVINGYLQRQTFIDIWEDMSKQTVPIDFKMQTGPMVSCWIITLISSTKMTFMQTSWTSFEEAWAAENLPNSNALQSYIRQNSLLILKIVSIISLENQCFHFLGWQNNLLNRCLIYISKSLQNLSTIYWIIFF